METLYFTEKRSSQPLHEPLCVLAARTHNENEECRDSIFSGGDFGVLTSRTCKGVGSFITDEVYSCFHIHIFARAFGQINAYTTKIPLATASGAFAITLPASRRAVVVR